MTPPKRILCECGCDAPETVRWPFRWWPYMLLAGALIAYALTGCTDSKASGPVHVLEIDAVVVKRFDTLGACEQFRDAVIVVQTLSGQVPMKMRCQ
jgi:hypothetical protein